MSEPRPLSELRSIVMPRLFLDLVFTKFSPLHNQSALLKSLEVFDFLTSETSSPFNTALLNTVTDRGPATMAIELFRYYFERGIEPFWFSNFTKDIPDVPDPIR